MRRLPDWPERLARVVEAARNRTFRWGEHDCALFALDCLDAQSGGNIAGQFRGTYDGPMSAALVFGPAGLLSFVAGVARTEGLVAVAPIQAGRGAICCFPWRLGPTLGLLDGRLILSPDEQGLRRIPRADLDLLACWTVP